MSDHVTTLTADLLIHELKEITKWQSLGLYLGLSIADIEEIEQDHPDTARRRMEMLKRWMSREVSPSWAMVVEALEKMSELRLAHQLREKYCTQQHKDEKPPTSTSEEQADSQAIERVLKVDRKDRVAREIEGFEDKYLVIVRELEATLKRENPSGREINRFSNYYMSKEVTKVEELFDHLQPLDYLNYTMLEKIIKYFLKQGQPVIGDLNDYIQDLEKFKQSTSVLQFMESIEAAQRPLSETEIPGTITVKLRLVGGWLKKTMNDLDKLLKVLFEDKSSVLSHIKIERGSVIITYLAPQAEADSIIMIAVVKTVFMLKVGVCELQVGETVVTSTQSETSDFIFESILLQAAKEDDIGVLKFLLDISTSPDATDDEGHTPLIIASYVGNSKAVSVLLKANANTEITEQDSPLHVASHLGHFNIVSMLLSANANPDLQTVDGNTPLYFASQEGHSDIVGLLLGAKADPNVCNHDGETPLHAASYFGYSNIVSLLLNSNANHSLEDNDEVTPLYLACQEGQLDAVTLLLKANADQNHLNGGAGTPLYIASRQGHSDIVHLLLKANSDFDLQADNGATPLHIASYHGHSDIISILLTANANLNSQGKHDMTPLYLASQKGHCGAINLLLEARANPNLPTSNGTTPLYIASEAGNSDVVSLLLKASADPNHQRHDGRTPLHVASYCGHSDIVRLLLKANANPNSQTDNGITPLHLASENGHCDVLNLLLEANADPNLRTNNVWTPLMLACFKHNPQIVQLLMTSGADPNHQTSDGGYTALMCACHVGCFESAELLLMYDADPSLRSHDGLTALDMAACKGHNDIVDLIQTIELSQSSSTSPVLTATKIATNVDNKALVSLYQTMEKMLVGKRESSVFQAPETQQNFPPTNEQEL